VTAYIIDTGILASHDEFKDRATQELNSAGGANEDCKDHSSNSQNTNVALDSATVTSLHSFCQDIQVSMFSVALSILHHTMRAHSHNALAIGFTHDVRPRQF